MVSGIIVAGGKGKRMGSEINKQYIKISDREILARTLEVFQDSDAIDEIIVVVSGDEVDYCRESIIRKYGLTKVKKIVAGGNERQNSVNNGLMACGPNTEIVVIHDGARPFIDAAVIKRSIEAARSFGACSTAVPVKDTIKIADNEGFSRETPDRNNLYAVQTPQTFKYDLILKAHKRAADENILATDDTMLVEGLGCRVKLIEGSYLNIKITTREDLIFAEGILSMGKL